MTTYYYTDAEELLALRKENAQLKQENENLKNQLTLQRAGKEEVENEKVKRRQNTKNV